MNYRREGLVSLCGIRDTKSWLHYWLVGSVSGAIGKSLSLSSSLGCMRRRRVVLGERGFVCHAAHRVLGRQSVVLLGRSRCVKELLGVPESFGGLACA